MDREPVEGGSEEESDAVLLARTRNGDLEAFGHLYARHVPAARATAQRLTRSADEVDDVVGEVFARVFDVVRRGLGPDELLRPYLVASIRHACARRVQRAATQAVTVDPTSIDEIPGTDDLDILVDEGFARRAYEALPLRWQKVLWRTEVEGCSLNEVAAELGLGPGAVAALAYRARKALRQAYLDAHLAGGGPDECADALARLARYVRGEASLADQRIVRAHLDSCARCRRAEAELARVDAILPRSNRATA